ncbi:hypothetical protein PW5551_02895 [Petrotoga sp. 9PW.55.5.1]|uniref:ROK family transcriptional regulator n=1 Tax=Petrotoga sp. 9PW.55.5.1 TaxID=1308979 RepID=UPI000DC35D3D|nr:ROK family protein [Petrotoga sp. 9PW.55.5.1]RAO99595.1 hypothetical protein PW5551_02895 [Petrotoga sp. 9PW.55.5.1]
MESKNVLEVFKTVQNKPLISRTEIAKITHLSQSTVGRCIQRLLGKNFLIEKTNGKSTGGRPPVFLDINKKNSFSVGIEIGESHIDVVLLNLVYEIIESKSKKIDNNITVESLTSIIQEMYDKILYESHISKEYIISVGLGVPGIVSADQKKLLLSPNLKWGNISLGEILEDKLQKPVFLDNGANLMTFAEYHFNKLPLDSMVLGIIVGKGIGTGLITKKEIFRGVNGAALEAGHSVIKLDGPLCSCGRKGCVEALASLPQMIRCYNSKTNKKVKNIDEFHQLVEQNDKLALSILDEEAYYLAILSANLANIINPSHIIIGGEISPILPYSIEKMKNLFNSQVLSTNKCELISSNLNEKSIAFGAAIMAIEKEIEEYL